MVDKFSRAYGALAGLALGDAFGMPTQAMSAEQIVASYGQITTLTSSVACQPVAPNMPAGSVTDDTEQALILADLLLENGGQIPPVDFALALLAWEDQMVARGSADLLGPSTKLALEQVRGGADPSTTGKTGTTNGAAMRVAPIGVATSFSDQELFCDRVYQSIMVTHDTDQGWQAAGLTACCVSAGVAGYSVSQAVRKSVDFMRNVPPRGVFSPKASVIERTEWAVNEIESIGGYSEKLEFLRTSVGTSVDSNESVPAAFAIAHAWADQPVEALSVAANLGGDTDTIGAIAGAIIGSCGSVEVFDKDLLNIVEEVNNINLTEYVSKLLALRDV